MKIAMIGAGYVGLTTGACLAELGNEVVCVDRDAYRIARLRRGLVPIFEPGLEALLARHARSGRLTFSDAIAEAVRGADAVFIAVGTPARRDGGIDLSQVDSAAVAIAPHLRPATLVVIKSTVVAGTARRVREIIAAARGADDVAVASNPEFLREGTAIEDFMHADRVVIGADEAWPARLLGRLYEPLARRGVKVVLTTTISAELTKYAANAFLALKIGFINDVADLCEATGGDIDAVALGIGLDRRIGPAFLSPGPGFGGSCFPKDTRAFARTGRAAGAPQPLVEALIRRNEARKRGLAARILAEFNGNDADTTVAVLGIAFKANTDDVRESAALTIVPMLIEAGIRVQAHDPKGAPAARMMLPGVSWCDTPYAAAEGADVTVVLTEWDDYRRLDLARLSRLMRGTALLDFRNLFSPEAVLRAGLHYGGLGRPVTSARQPQRALPDGIGARANANAHTRTGAGNRGGTMTLAMTNQVERN